MSQPQSHGKKDADKRRGVGCEAARAAPRAEIRMKADGQRQPGVKRQVEKDVQVIQLAQFAGGVRLRVFGHGLDFAAGDFPAGPCSSRMAIRITSHETIWRGA